MLPAQPNLSLINGLQCLQVVAASPVAVGSRDLARQLGLEHTRVSRLLGTLAHLGLVRKTANRKYRPGPGLHVLSAQSLFGSGLLRAALPHLRELAAERLILAMGVLWNRHVCYLVHARPGEDPAGALGAHDPYPAQGSILGVALLACLPDAEVCARFRDEDSPLHGAALAEFVAGLRDVRESGVAVRHFQPGQSSVACVVGSPPVAAVSLTGQDISPERLAHLAGRLRAVAAAITRALADGPAA